MCLTNILYPANKGRLNSKRNLMYYVASPVTCLEDVPYSETIKVDSFKYRTSSYSTKFTTGQMSPLLHLHISSPSALLVAAYYL